MFDPTEKYIPSTIYAGDSLSMPDTIMGGTVAVMGDLGTGVWNSLVPEKFEASTEDVLSAIDKDALAVYEQHPDTIKTLSFVGGILAPAGISLKAMNYLRSGAKASNWFSDAAQVSKMGELNTFMQRAGPASNEARLVRNKIYAAIAGNALIDSVAAEGAIALTMNAHPYMEDYMEDFGSNFLLSVGIGGAIGAPIGAIIKKGEMAKIGALVEGQLFGEIRKNVQYVDPARHLGDQVAYHNQNVRNLEGTIARAENVDNPFTLSDFTIRGLKDLKVIEEARMIRKFEESVEGVLASPETSKEVKDFYLELAKKFEFAGADTLQFAKIDAKAIEKGAGLEEEVPSLFKRIKNKITLKQASTADELEAPVVNDLAKSQGVEKLGIAGTEEIVTKADAIYSPVHRRFFSVKEGGNYLTAADIGKDLKQLLSGVENTLGFIPRGDTALLRSSEHSALLDADAIIANAYIQNKSLTEISAMKIAPSDINMLRAVANRITVLEQEVSLNPKLINSPSEKLSLTLVDDTTEAIKVDGLLKLAEVIPVKVAEAVKGLAKEGFGIESIAIRTAIPNDSVARILAGDEVLLQDLIKYNTKESMEKALLQTNRGLQISTNVKKVPSAEVTANLNRAGMDQLSNGLVEYNMRSSSSDIVRSIASTLFGNDMKVQSHYLAKEIQQITQSELGSTLFRSANSVLEKWPAMAAITTEMGKNTTHFLNKIKQQFQEPLGITMGGILKNQAELIEANTAINFNASLSGRRFYAHGQLWIPSKEATWTQISEVLKLDEGEFRKFAATLNDKREPLAVAAKYKGEDYAIRSKNVQALFSQFQEYGRHMYELKNTYKTGLGSNDLPDIGLWIPAFNPRDKEVAYVHDLISKETSMLYARSQGELLDGIAEYEKKLKAEGRFNTTRIIRKDMQKDFNDLANRHDPMYMGVADVGKFHSGSSTSALVSTNSSLFSDIVNGYDSYITRGVEDIVQMQLGDVMNHLENVSRISQAGHSPASLGVISRVLNKPTDPGQVVKNIILGRSNLSQHTGWAEWQQRGQIATDMLLRTMGEVSAPIIQSFHKGEKRTEATWSKLLGDMESKGIVNPFSELDKARYIAEGTVRGENLTTRGIALFNGIAATSVLRFMDLAQPLVNLLSLPVLTSGAVNRRLASSFMGAQLADNVKFSANALMHDGIRLMHHPIEGKRISLIAEDRNLFDSIISEANAVMSHAKNLEKGALSKGEDALESTFVKMMGKPADWAEATTRKVSFFTGWAMAKKAYPGISDIGATTFARNFMDEAIGNYHAAQRPAMFHGSFGPALGLFQTYMLTLGQQVYRGIEAKNWAALGKQMFAQQTIFGTSSLPGFRMVSEAIADNFSDQNIDLQTGTFRAIEDNTANILLYGLPSTLGAGITTRGDIQPRVPNFLAGVDNIAAVNFATQSYQAMERVARAAFSADENAGRALLEAVSLQSMNRPLARFSELLSGTAITSKGELVTNNDRMYTAQSIASRIMATRPLEEIKAREALHLNSLYGSLDTEKRGRITERMKTAIRSGDLDDETYAELQYQYMRTGSNTGWKSAVSKAIKQAGQPGSVSVMERFRPASPLNMMIEDME